MVMRDIQPIDGVVVRRQIVDVIISDCINRRLNSGGVVGGSVADSIKASRLNIGGTIATSGRDDRQIGKYHTSKGSIGLVDDDAGAAGRTRLLGKRGDVHIADLTQDTFIL